MGLTILISLKPYKATNETKSVSLKPGSTVLKGLIPFYLPLKGDT